MRKKILALALAVALTTPAYAVVGPASPAPELATQVLMVLIHTATGAGFCTGTVLSPTKVLTAAHCVGRAEAMKIFYRDAQNAPILLDISDVTVHPDFHEEAPKTREKSIDLAMITLVKPLPKPFEPADLTQPAEYKLGDTMTLAGFGLHQENEAASSGKLLQGKLHLRAPKSDVLLWLENTNGIGACTGDSGGPVFYKGALVAVIAWSEGIAPRHCGKLTQAIRLSGQMDWVRQEMGR
jgi:Trypsin